MGQYEDLEIVDLMAHYAPSPMIEGLHRDQALAFYDTHRFKCVLAGRQSGKSHLDATWLLGGESGQTSLYFADTIKSAWNIMYSVFAEINKSHNLGLKVKRGSGEIVEPNGHVIRIHGIKDYGAAEDLRGQKFRRICGDEASVYDDDLLKYTIEDVLQPTLLKYGGDLMLNGTPGPEPEGYFYDLAGDPYSGIPGRWPTFHWTVDDNPYILPEKVIQDILIANGWTRETVQFQREYLARWVADHGALIYQWEDRPLLSEGPVAGMTVLAVDFGYHPDPTAFVVLRSVQPKVYVLKAFTVNNLTPYDIGNVIQELRKTYHPNFVVTDSGALGKGYAAQLIEQFQINVDPADKQDKTAGIHLIQGMIQVGTLEICQDAAALVNEWKKLVWSPRKKTPEGRILPRTHHPKYRDDCTDATIYGLKKMLLLEPYKAPADPRDNNVVEMERRRTWARAQAESAGRGRQSL